MKAGLLRIISLVRNFLFSSVNKEFLIFLFFLALSGAFWLSMTLDESYEKELAVPIKMVNIPKNAVITTELEDTVRVTIRDK
ncbi:MAG TPA: YbbR-like domain-containing protein, partial [Prevotella sp.]